METTIVQLQKEMARRHKLESKTTRASKRQTIVSGFRLKWVHFILKLSLIKIGMTCYRNPLDGIRALRYLILLRRRFLGDNRLQKMVYAGGKYYMGLFTPGWNSAVYKRFITSQLHDFKSVSRGEVNRFNTVFLAITKKCALQCEHCYEWDNLNKKEVLTNQKLLAIVQKLQKKGASQIHLSGGEPLLKMDSLTYILEQAERSTDFWILTSGFKLNATNAKRLKDAGLTGAIISLDHFIPEKHNAFRQFKDAFHWVEEAVENAKNNDLVTALSLCATRDFISEENLMAYMKLAKKLGVSFVQLLEPKAVGHYANEDVLLGVEDIRILEDFFLKMNCNKEYESLPIITYHGYYQRRQGCYSAGIKGMYVDTDGDMNACPFCHKKTGNVLDNCFEKNLETMRSEGCSSYKIKTR